jgi:hypothetical protein
MSSFLIGVALMMVGSSTERAATEHKTSVCEISHDPARYLGRKVVVDALFVDAEPHGAYISDPDSNCIVHIGSMAAAQKGDVSDYFDEGKVRIHAILKTEMRDDPFGRGPYQSYFLDQMEIIRLQP